MIRGSWSTFVGAWDLARFGRATKVGVRRSLAGRPHDHVARLAAKAELNYPAVHFAGVQALAVSRGFAAAVGRRGYQVYACSILPDHVHVVVARCERSIEEIVAHLKFEATRRLAADGLHPLADCRDSRGNVPSPWAKGRWKCFLDDEADIERTIRYVEANPEKEGKRRQSWPFVVAWEGRTQ